MKLVVMICSYAGLYRFSYYATFIGFGGDMRSTDSLPPVIGLSHKSSEIGL